MPIIYKGRESTLYRSCATHSGWETCRQAWEALHYPLEEDQTRSFPLERTGGILSVIEGAIAPQIWQTLPLQDHRIIQPHAADLDMFQTAFHYLDHHHGNLLSDTREFIQAVALVDLREEERKDAICVTSVSIPDLPFCSFLSYKALFHIPPNIVVTVPDIRFLAENLYHESIHHQVTLNLLENELLQEEYHTKLSPQVAIPWREGGLSRMKYWELDRVMHAFNVYVALLPYRLKETHDHPTSPWRTYFEQALSCAQFLGKTLWTHRNVLTALGQEYVFQQWGNVQTYCPHVDTEPLALS